MNLLYIILIILLFFFIIWICNQTIGPPDWSPPFYTNSKNNINNKIPEIYIIYDVPN